MADSHAAAPLLADGDHHEHDYPHEYCRQSDEYNEDEHADKNQSESAVGAFIWLLACAAGISGLLFGYDTGVISATLLALSRGGDLTNHGYASPNPISTNYNSSSSSSEPDSFLSTTTATLITSAPAFAALPTTAAAGWLADQLGRRTVLAVSGILFVIGALVQAWANGVGWMVVGRGIVGAGVGAGGVVTPLYMAELSPARLRGRLVTVYVLFCTGGQVIAYLVGWGLTVVFKEIIAGGISNPGLAGGLTNSSSLEPRSMPLDSPKYDHNNSSDLNDSYAFSIHSNKYVGYAGWRVLVGLGALPALVQLVLLVGLPESPRWLVRCGRVGVARGVLERVYGGKHDENEDNGSDDGQVRLTVDSVVHAIEQELVAEASQTDFSDNDVSSNVAAPHAPNRAVCSSLLCSPGRRRALALACGLQALQQLSGFNALMYYSAPLFAAFGFGSPTRTSLAIALANFAGTALSFVLVDRANVGRRRVLLATLPVMAVALGVVAISCATGVISDYGGVLDQPAHQGRQPLPLSSATAALPVLVALTLYCFAYAGGIGTIPWNQSELFPLRVRAAGAAAATATNAVTTAAVAASFLPLLRLLGGTSVFGGYAMICAAGAAGVWKWYPELAGMGLEEVRGLLAEGWGVEESIRRFQERERR